jgi:hypothetical protein
MRSADSRPTDTVRSMDCGCADELALSCSSHLPRPLVEPKSYSTYPPTDQCELFYTDAVKRAALDYKKEVVMGPQIDRLSSRLPRRFPIGAEYVVEGYGGEKGNLRVIARYVVLPGGRRIMFHLVFPSQHLLQAHCTAAQS